MAVAERVRPSVIQVPDTQPLLERNAYLAYRILHVGFTAAVLAAGIDKFFSLLTTWTQYLSPLVLRAVPLTAAGFMQLVGVIEIMAGLTVALKPRIGGYIVAAWLVGIIVNLLTMGGYFDVALRDLGLAMGAVALARLATYFDR